MFLYIAHLCFKTFMSCRMVHVFDIFIMLPPYIARINMKKCPLFVDVLSICRKYMIARILNLLQLVAELSAIWQHQIVSHYLHGFTN